MKLGIAEILNKADKAKVKADKTKILRDNASNILLDTLRIAFEGYKFNFLDPVVYKVNDWPGQEGALFSRFKHLPKWFLENPKQELSLEKRKVLWIQFLEILSKEDAEMIESLRLKGKLPYKTITKALVMETFPEVFRKEENATLVH